MESKPGSSIVLQRTKPKLRFRDGEVVGGSIPYDRYVFSFQKKEEAFQLVGVAVFGQQVLEQGVEYPKRFLIQARKQIDAIAADYARKKSSPESQES